MAIAQPDTLLVFSETMQKNIPTLIVTPSSYHIDSTKKFPTLYMLHGYSGDFLGYYNYMPDLQSLSDTHQIIFVFPDGGYNSWYFDSPYGKECSFETFLSKELVEKIDSNYRTIKDKNHRAIMGLSMGGHGALYNAIRHPEVFGAAGSMSGGVDLTHFPLQWEIRDRLGDYLIHKKRWEENTVINMISQIPKDFPLIVDCGVDDFFIEVNREFHKKLLKAKIPHDYIERNGEHNWDYWANATRFQLLFFKHFFNKNN